MTDPKPRPSLVVILGGGFLALVVVAFVALAVTQGPRGESGPAIKIGAEVAIHDPAGGTVLVYADKASFDAAVKAASVKDRAGFDEATRSAFSVDAGTRALVLEYFFPSAYRLRIKSGPHASRAGFLPSEYLRP